MSLELAWQRTAAGFCAAASLGHGAGPAGPFPSVRGEDAIRLKKRRNVPVILQRDASECLTTCLAMVFKHWGMYNIQDVLRDLGHVSAQGANLETASELAKEFGFEALGFHCQWESRPTSPLRFTSRRA